MTPRPSPERLIRCAHCGEDYSPTYRKCPFCGMKNDPKTSVAPEPPRRVTRVTRPEPEPVRSVPVAEEPAERPVSRAVPPAEDYDEEPTRVVSRLGRSTAEPIRTAPKAAEPVEEPVPPARPAARSARYEEEEDIVPVVPPVPPARSAARSARYEEDEEPVRRPAPRARRQEDEYDDGYVFDGQDMFDDDYEDEDDYRPARGGKRLAGGGNGGRDNGGGWDMRPGKGDLDINWPRVITFLCSLVIIIAAMVIVFTWVYPKLRKDPSTASSDPGTAVTDPVAGTAEPGGSTDAPVTETAGPGGEQTDAPVNTPDVGGEVIELNDFTLDATEITLAAGNTHSLVPTFDPVTWTGDVVWTSSDERYATVDAAGAVTNVNTEAGTTQKVTITVTAGGIQRTCIVNCVGPAAPATQPPATEPPATQAPSSGGDVKVGAKGVIVNAAGGLRVRSGPGTEYDQVSSLRNGAVITVVRDAGNGWYEITFSGKGGNPTPGYIMGDYISTD